MTEELTPTTPKPNARFADPDNQQKTVEPSNPTTPTTHDFGGIPGQRALPGTPFTPSDVGDTQQPAATPLNRGDSHRSVNTQRSDGSDIEMADDDAEDQEESDNESATGDSEEPRKKKKKGLKFFCTDFPPCNLSFTRSEHLARHIRFVRSVFPRLLSIH